MPELASSVRYPLSGAVEDVGRAGVSHTVYIFKRDAGNQIGIAVAVEIARCHGKAELVEFIGSVANGQPVLMPDLATGGR